jgi:hypothetical protein
METMDYRLFPTCNFVAKNKNKKKKPPLCTLEAEIRIVDPGFDTMRH